VFLSKGEKSHSLYLQKLASLIITGFFILDPLFMIHKSIVASKLPKVNFNPNGTTNLSAGCRYLHKVPKAD
jgi:hypothetical protein